MGNQTSHNWKEHCIAKIILKNKKEVGGVTLHYFQSYKKVIIIKVVLRVYIYNSVTRLKIQK
jgi:hypothetical protein